MAQKANTHTAPPRYDETFKQGAIQMVTEQKRTIKEAASNLGICMDTIKKWLKDTGIQPIAADHGNRDAKKIRELETENHALKKFCPKRRSVGLSNMLDSMQVQVFAWQEPAKGTHRPIVGATEMVGELV